MPPEKKCRLIQSDVAAIDECIGRGAMAEHVHEEPSAGPQPVVHAGRTSRGQLRMCSNISTDTTRSKPPAQREVVHVGGDDLDVVEALGAARAPGWTRAASASWTRRRCGWPGIAAPSTASASPSRSPVPARAGRRPVARARRSRPAPRASASARSVVPSGHQALLYLRCGPSTCCEELRRHFVVLLVGQLRQRRDFGAMRIDCA